MKTIYLFFIHLVTGLWHSHHYHSIRKRHYISPSFKSSTSSSSSEVIPVVQSTNVLSTNRDLLIDDLRKSKVLYQFILTFSERARKELSFSLFVEHDFAAFLFGVLRFNRRVQWASLSNDLKSIIHQYVELEINDTSSAQVTRYIDILWCLGKLSIDFRTQPTSLQAVILNKLITFDSVSIGREISRILYSLSLMQLRWIDIPSQSRRTLLDLLTTYLPSMNVVEVVNSVYALGRMGCSWKTLPKPLYQELFVHVQRSVSMSGVISISNLLW